MSDIISKRIMIAAPRSGSGKTTITCALLEALKDRGCSPISFKVGPDYIDPMFHKKILGIDSRNLDIYFSESDGIRDVMSEVGDSFAVIEGVMGLYDGANVDGTYGSSYEVAAVVQAPIVLVIDASGVGRTIISLIKGMILDDINYLIKGIILNKINEGFYEKLKPVLEEELSKVRDDIKLLGFFPKDPSLCIDSRHLGLKLPNEINDIKEKLSDAAAALEKHADIPSLISIMEGADRVRLSDADIEELRQFSNDVADEKNTQELTLAVASDEAFCFYYKDNLELFEKSGVKLKFFSPIADEKLPEECDGILIGGGYPENYLEDLSQNKSMLASIKNALDKGIPSLAECGGFMYLHKQITDMNGNSYEMVGSIDGNCHYVGHLVRFGYMEIEAVNQHLWEQDSSQDNWDLIDSLVGMRGHEFHYFDSSMNGDLFVASKPNKEKKWNCMIMQNNGIWGFPHFYYKSNPEFIKLFIKKMKEVKNGEFK